MPSKKTLGRKIREIQNELDKLKEMFKEHYEEDVNDIEVYLDLTKSKFEEVKK